MSRSRLLIVLLAILGTTAIAIPPASSQVPSGGSDIVDMGRASPVRGPVKASAIDPTIDWPPKITLLADNGKFLSRMGRKNQQNCEASKARADQYCEFQVEVIGPPGDHVIALKGDNGKYLSRVRRVTVDHVEFAKDKIDPYCKFHYVSLKDGKVALKGDNGRFLGRVQRKSGQQNIEAAKPTMDRYSQFTVGERIVDKEITDIVYDLDRVSISEVSPLVTQPQYIDNASSSATIKKTLTYKYSKRTVRSWNNEIGITVGVEASFQAGSPVYKGGVKVSVEGSRKWDWGGSEDVTEEVSDATEVTVPPMTRVQVQVVVKRARIDVPFTYTVNRRQVNGEITVQKGLRGVYHNEDCFRSEVAVLDRKNS